MNIYLYETRTSALKLEPLCSTRPIFDLKCGAFSVLERIKKIFPNDSITVFIRNELKGLIDEKNKININPEIVKDGLWLNSNIIWNQSLIEKFKNKHNVFSIKDINVGFYLSEKKGNQWILKGGPVEILFSNFDSNLKKISISKNECIEYLWDCIYNNSHMLVSDTRYFKMGSINCSYEEKFFLINEKNIVIPKSAIIRTGAILDAKSGPVIISENVMIEPGAYLEGPLFIGEGVTIKACSKILKGSYIGPGCKVGGEIIETIFQGWSNKQHDGFLGHSYIGEWVNLGAGTNNSDLKNNYSTVKIFINNKEFDSKQLFIGLFMGDHSKSAIATKFNTGTIVGVGSNIIFSSFPPKNLKPFSWYNDINIVKHDFKKFVETAKRTKLRRNKFFSKSEEKVFYNIFKQNEIDVD